MKPLNTDAKREFEERFVTQSVRIDPQRNGDFVKTLRIVEPDTLWNWIDKSLQEAYQKGGEEEVMKITELFLFDDTSGGLDIIAEIVSVYKRTQKYLNRRLEQLKTK